jgi:hypothetical protein
MNQLAPFLASQSAQIVVLKESGCKVPASLAGYPDMGFVFSRDQLARTLAPQLV